MRTPEQKIFEQESQKAVKMAVNTIKAATADKISPKETLYQLLNDFGAARKKIAIEQNVTNPEVFGADRRSATDVSLTVFDKQYAKYGAKLKDELMEELRKIQKDLIKNGKIENPLKEFPGASATITHQMTLGIESHTVVEVLGKQEIMARITTDSQEELTQLLNATGLTADPTKTHKDYKELISKNHNLALMLRKNAPDLHRKYEFTALLGTLYSHDRLNSLKSEWVVMTRYATVNGETLPLSSCVTWMYRTHVEDPISHMEEFSIISIYHQNTTFLDDMLENIAKVFGKILAWSPNDGTRKLQDLSAVLQYQFAHCMPFHRGSAAISEWLESALYLYHGYDLQRVKNESVNNHAFALTLPDFIEKYKTILSIQKPRTAWDMFRNSPVSQMIFKRQSVKNIADTCQLLRQGMAVDKVNTDDLLDHVLLSLGTSRNNLARVQKAPAATEFGQVRTKDSVTGLIQQYEQYGKKQLTTIVDELKKIERTNKNDFPTITQTTDEGAISNVGTQLVIQSFNGAEVETLKEKAMQSSLELLFQKYELSYDRSSDELSNLQDFMNNSSARTKLKTEDPETFKDFKLLIGLTHVYTCGKYPGPKSTWILATRYMKTQSATYELSQYITWMYSDLKHDPIEKMSAHSKVILLHTDPTATQKINHQLRPLFNSIMNWDQAQGQEKLHDLSAQIQYLFAHAMPYMRGTASIAEWLESAIYQFHGFDLERIDGKNVNCSALIMSYQDFRDEYLNLFILHEQEPQKAITMGAT